MPFVLDDETEVKKETSEKKRFVLEEEPHAGIKRKAKIALGSLAEGVSYPLAVIKSITSPGKTIEMERKEIVSFFKSMGLDDPEAEDRAEEYIEAGFKGAGAGAAFGPIAALGSGVSAVGEEVLKDLGVPEPIPQIAGAISAFLMPSGLSKTGKIAEASKKTAKVIQKEGLPPVRGILKDQSEFIKPVTSKGALENFERKIETAVKDASEKILEQSLLGKRLEKQGTIIGDLIEGAYKQASDIGKTINKTVNLNKASTIIGLKADKIEKSAPSLSGPTEEIVKKLRKYQKDFSGNRITPEQFQNQYREVNIDLNNLYRKPELTGAEEALRKSLEDVKSVLLKEAQAKFKNPQYINSFKQANKLFSEARKLDKANALFEPVWDKGFNSNRFKSLFQNPKKYHELSQSIGPKSAERLRDISKYYVDPIGKMTKRFKIKDPLDFQSLIGSGIVAKMVGIPGAVAKFATVDLPPRIQARLMMNEGTQSIWLKLMKSIQHGSPRLIQKYAESLEEDLSKEDQ